MQERPQALDWRAGE